VTTPLALNPGRVIAVGNVRTHPNGMRLWCSRDGGATWDEPPVQLWDPRAERVVGEPLPVEVGEGGKAWQSLPAFTFGMPDLVRFKDDSVLMTYWATLNEVFHVRACRFRLE